MAYDFYMDKLLLPVPPKKLQLKVSNSNKTVTLINDGEINVLKTPGLTDIDFDVLLPHAEYSFTKYKDGFKPAEYFLKKFKDMKQNKEVFQFIVARQMPNGKSLYGTNMKVSLEDYTIREDADDGFDTTVTIRLKQYRDYGTKTCNVTYTGTKPTTSVSEDRAISNNAPSENIYVVQSGDSLWKIARKFYNKATQNLVMGIYNANKSVIGSNPNMIHPGQKLTIPTV